MFRTLTVIAAFAAIAGSASAAEVRVSLVGKDPETIRADIEKAAHKACRADPGGQIGLDLDMKDCVAAAVAGAIAQIKDPDLVAYYQAHPASKSAGTVVAVASMR